MVHLLKMCVGCESIEDLREWQADRIARGEALKHRTRNRPKRGAEIVGEGSIYWIIKGRIRVRQRIVSIETVANAEGERVCHLGLDPDLIETVAVPFRPMQGWRYLEAADAPPDLGSAAGDALPASLVQELKQLGLA